MRVPFLDVGATYRELAPEMDKAFKKVLKGGWYILGQEVEAFEKEYAKFCGTKYCVGVANGMDALELLLRAYNIGPGDEVIVPANTYIATVLVINIVGATPVLVEMDPATYNIDHALIKQAITKKTKAIMPVHLYGQCADIRSIKSAVKNRKIIIIEDAAQAQGATHHGQRAGNLGDSAGFSFYPGKNLGAYGDAGAITTNSKVIADRVKVLRNYGSEKKYYNLVKGMNSRLDEIQAAMLRVKLKKVSEWNQRRRELAKIYLSKINPKKNPKFILPTELKGNKHIWHVFVVRTKKREKFMEFLHKNGVEYLIHYPLPFYKQKAYKELNHLAKNFPLTNQAANEIISLPIGSHMKKSHVRYVCKVVNKFIDTYL